MQTANKNFSVTPEKAEKAAVRRDANFVGFLLLALLVGQLVVGLLLGIGMMSGVLTAGADDYGLGNTAYLLLNMLSYLLYLLVPTLITAGIARRTESPFPIKRVGGGVYSVAIFGGMAIAVLANFVSSYLMAALAELGVPYPEFPSTVEPTALSLVLNLISTALLPALVEELVFRGYMLGALRPHGDRMAIVVTAVLFGLIHGNLVQFPFALILGLMLGWLTVQTGSILPAVLLHFTNNALSVLLNWAELFLPEGNRLTQAAFAVFCGLGAIAFLAVYAAKTRYKDDLLRRVGNGVSRLSVSRRAAAMVTAPALLVGGLAWIGMLLLSVVM